MKKNIFSVKNSALFVLFFLYGCSSSSPVIDDTNEARPGITDIEHFGSLNDKKISEIAFKENPQKTPTETPQKAQPAKDSSQLVNIDELSPREQTPIIENARGINEINQSFSIESALQDNTDLASDLDVDNKVNNINLRGEKSNEKLAISSDQSINAVTRVVFNSNIKNVVQKTNSGNTNKLCNKKTAKFKSFNDLTQHITNCKWRLPLVLKMNNIKNVDEFIANQEIYFPSAIYKDINDENNSVAADHSTQVSCDSYTAKISKLSAIQAIAKKCQWNANQLIIFNDITKKLQKKQATYTILLPPAISKLQQKYTKNALSRDNLPQTNSSKRTTPKQNTTSPPTWCQNSYYTAQKDSKSIAQIASLCHFNATLLSVLNDNIPINSPIPSNQQIIMPSVFNVTVKRKQYQIPLEPRHCNKKNYYVEYGISISKVASTCQWNYKYLLKLNNLDRQSILHINDKLIFPTSLYNKPKSIRENAPVTSQNAVKEIAYQSLCNQNSYLFSINDDLVKIAQTCRWDISRLTAINDTALSKVTQGAQLILLPNLIDQISAISKKKNSSPKKVRQTNIELKRLVTVCIQNKIDIGKDDKNFSKIANTCGFKPLLLNRLNLKISGIQNAQELILPSSLYQKSDTLQDWFMPVMKNQISSIYQRPNAQNTSYFEVKKGSSDKVNIYNVQQGIVSYIDKSPTNSYTMIIRHTDGYTSVYSNLDHITQKSGYVINPNEIIGELHLENKTPLKYQLFQNGKPVSFINILKK